MWLVERYNGLKARTFTWNRSLKQKTYAFLIEVQKIMKSNDDGKGEFHSVSAKVVVPV